MTTDNIEKNLRVLTGHSPSIIEVKNNEKFLRAMGWVKKSAVLVLLDAHIWQRNLDYHNHADQKNVEKYLHLYHEAKLIREKVKALGDSPVKQPVFYPLVHLDNLIDMHHNGENWTTIESEIKTMIRVLEKQGHCRPEKRGDTRMSPMNDTITMTKREFLQKVRANIEEHIQQNEYIKKSAVLVLIKKLKSTRGLLSYDEVVAELGGEPQ